MTGKKQSDGTYLATAKIKGKGNYTGTYTTTFVINPAEINEAAVADIKVQSYKNGKEIKPALKVKVNGRTLRRNKDYTVTYVNNKLRGKAQAVITGIGNYSGTVTKTFTIK